jgi:putative ABC transport system substrate-binding protein
MPLAALQRETRTIPIVFSQVEDPVTLGFVASISHPGGNITGFTQFEYAIGTQWVELLKQMVPNMTRVAVIYDADYLGAPGFLPMMEPLLARTHWT